MKLPADFTDLPRPEHPYFGQVYDFMKSWKEGQNTFVLHTSGSTGTPKPITLHREQLAASAVMTGKALYLGAGTRALVCLNVGYIAGLMMLVRGMELGWQLEVIEPVSNPLLAVDEQAHFDFVALVPMQLAAMMENSLTAHQIVNLGSILLGGAPVSRAQEMAIQSLDIPVFQSYGMTETVSHVALRKLNGPGASGSYSFLPGIEFGVDTRGCLHLNGKVTNHLLVQTNDLAEIDGNTFKWLGRYDNVVNSGGVKIVLDQLDQQIAATLLALNIESPFFTWHLPDEKLGQKLILVIEKTSAEVDQEQIRREMRKTISAYEIPKHIYFADEFVKTPTGKTDKQQTVHQFLHS